MQTLRAQLIQALHLQPHGRLPDMQGAYLQRQAQVRQQFLSQEQLSAEPRNPSREVDIRPLRTRNDSR